MSASETPRHILGYSTFFRLGARLHLALCCFFAFITLVAISSAIFDFPKSEPGMAGSAFAAGLVAVMHFVLYFKFTHPFASAKYFVFNDRLELHRGSHVTVAHYGDIVKMYGRVFPFVAGAFGFILKDGRSFHFGAAVKDSHCILEAISDYAPARRAELADLRASLIVLHRGYARFLAFLGKNRAIHIPLHLFAVPFAFSAYLVTRQAKAFTIIEPIPFFLKTFVLIGLAVFVLANFFSFALNRMIDLPMLEQIEENPNSLTVDAERERSIFRDAMPVYLFALFALLGAYNRFDLNTLGRVEISSDVPHLGIEAGQEYWVDQRANCVACSHPLYSGDVVLFKTEGGIKIGKLVALPGTVAELVTPAGTGRKPASATTKLAAGKVAVRFDTNGEYVEAIDLKDVIGRTETTLGAFVGESR